MSKIIVSGSLAYDRIMDYPGLFADSILPDKSHTINLSFLVDKLSVEFGGTAGNIAYNLALIGEQPEIIATAGQDFASYRSHLLLLGIAPDSIRILEGALTSSAFVFTDTKDNQIAAFYPGAGGSAYDTPVALEGRALAIVSPGCAEDMMALPMHYRRNNMKYLFDPGQQTLSLTSEALQAGIDGAQIVFASDYEVGLIAQKTGWTEDVILDHTQTLVVTHGAEGSRVLTSGAQVAVPAAISEKTVDPTGAGDAYRAGFIRGLLAGLTNEQCARLGSVIASFCVETYGTQNHRFTLDQIKERYKKSYNEDLNLS